MLRTGETTGDVKAVLVLKKGGNQSLEFLSNIPQTPPILSNSPQVTNPIPLSSFSFSLSLGVQPSNGTIKVSGKFIPDDLLRTANLENAEIHIRGGEFVEFKKLRITDFSFSPLNAEPGGDRVYSLNFQDSRWRLEKGGVYGYFNRTLKIKDKQTFLDATVNSETSSPWTYLELVEKVADIAGMKIRKPESTGSSYSCGLSYSTGGLERLDEFPLNKEYNGESPADVLSDILNEIDFTITITPEGIIFLSPLAGTIKSLPQAKTQPLQSSVGAKYKSIPDSVYVVGGRVRDQIKIEPNLSAFTDSIDPPNAQLVELTLDLSSGMTTVPSIENSDRGLMPVCPDITGKIRDFYDLLKTWKVTFVNAARVHMSPHEGVWRGLLGEGIPELIALEETLAKKINEYYELIEANAARSFMKAKAKEVYAAKEAADHARNYGGDRSRRKAAADARLYPNERTFLKENPDFDALAEKVRIAQKYFFRLFQIPATVSVHYDWSNEELAEVKGKFAPDAKSGKVPVPRSYVLPFKEYIDEWKEIDNVEDEEKDDKKQSDKGKSEAEKSGSGKIDFLVSEEKKKRRFRVWGYSYGRDAIGIYSFSRKELKELGNEVVDTNPELGLILFSKTPYILSRYSGFSEDCLPVYDACPIGIEFAYDRKDPSLGVLNYFVHKLKKPASVKGTPPSRKEKITAFEQIDEIIEHLDKGKTQDRDDLAELTDNYALEIWEKQAGTEASQSRCGVAKPVYAYPEGPLQAVSWRSDPFITLFELNTDYQAFNRGTLSNRIKKALQTKKMYHRSETLDQKFLNQRGFWRLPDKERLLEDERRILINTPHFGSIVMYDPKEGEDVIAISAQLDDPASHHHKKFWLGPLLCRPPRDSGFVTTLMTPETLYGHFWYAAGHDPCLLGTHSHKVGGFYYPYVYAKRDITGPPLDPIPTFEGEALFPGSVMLVNEGATAALASAMKWIYDPTHSVKLADEELIYLSNPYIPPKDADKLSFAASLLVEFCVGEVVAAPTSATFSISWQLINSNECFGTGLGGDPRTGSGTYVLNIPAGNAFEYHRMALFPIGVVGDFSYGFDALAAEVSRNYTALENSFAYPIYFFAAKLVFGWLETTPQAATFAP